MTTQFAYASHRHIVEMAKPKYVFAVAVNVVTDEWHPNNLLFKYTHNGNPTAVPNMRADRQKFQCFKAHAYAIYADYTMKVSRKKNKKNSKNKQKMEMECRDRNG